jgi:extradiol dioxygenase family protein
MRNIGDTFHLAIPVRDLAESEDFYVAKLGCKLARRYEDRITLDFFGDQVVCHLAPQDISKKAEFYPRHFGVSFLDKKAFDDVYRLAKQRDLPMLADLTCRFKNACESHMFFGLVDPSNNVIEFKYYTDPRMMY